LNETGLEIGSSKKVTTIEVESIEEGAATEAIMTKKKPGVVRNSVNHHSHTFTKTAPPESKSQCLQDSTEEVQLSSWKGSKSKEKEGKRVKASANDEVFKATYEKRQTRHRGVVNIEEDPQPTLKRKEDAINSAEKEKLVNSKKKKV
jgi:hypothetical protein